MIISLLIKKKQTNGFLQKASLLSTSLSLLKKYTPLTFLLHHIELINTFCWLYLHNVVRIKPIKHLNMKTTMSEMINI